MDRHYIPATDEGVQGVPEEHPDDSTMFMAGIAQHSTQNKKKLLFILRDLNIIQTTYFIQMKKVLKGKTLRTKGELKLIKTINIKVSMMIPQIINGIRVKRQIKKQIKR